MSDDVKALIADAREIALSSRSLPLAKSVIRRLADALEAAQVPATDDEREALWEVADEYLEKNNIEDLNPPGLSETFADMVWAAGFRRSSRVPVSRDELAENLRRIHFDGTGCGTTASTACSNCFGPSPMTAREIAEHLSATHDIYPKADRNTADSGEAER